MGVGLSPLFRRFERSRFLARGAGVSFRPSFDWAAGLFRAVAASLRAERERWPLWLPVGLGIGIAGYFALAFEPSDTAAILIAAGAMFAIILAPAERFLALRAALMFAAAIAIGFSAAKFRTDWVAAPVIPHKTGPVGISGQVESAEAHGKGVRATIAVRHIDRFSRQAMPHRVRVSFRSGTAILKPGAWIGARAVLMPPPEPAEPGGYDFGRTAFYRGLGAVGYAYGKPQAIAALRPPGWREQIASAIDALRWKMTARIHAVLPGSTGSIAAALITGDRGGISDEDEQALRDAGLAHVLAIAGLHMALVGLGLFWAVRALLALIPAIALTQPIKKWAAVAALCAAAFYLIISGAAVPTTRAFIMLAMMLVAILVDRPAISMRSVAMAAAFILLTQPESLIEPGFQMSFAAVVSLVAVVEWEQGRERLETGSPAWRTARRYFGGIALTSFVGSLATLPFAVFHFDRATHYAVLGNLAAMPVMGLVVMPSAALAVLLMPFGLDAAPLHLMGWGIGIMLAVGRWVSHLPGSVSVVAAWPVWTLALISLGGLWIFLWRRSWRWAGLVPLVAGLCLAMTAPQPDVLIARDGRTVAVRGGDGMLRLIGNPRDKYSAGEWLKRAGDERLPADAVATAANGVRCDELGCIARARNGMTIAAVKRGEALGDDCANAAIVISAVATRGRCSGPKLVIDRFDVAHNGAYALWLGPTIRIQTAQGERGLRPWSQRPRRKPFRDVSSGG